MEIKYGVSIPKKSHTPSLETLKKRKAQRIRWNFVANNNFGDVIDADHDLVRKILKDSGCEYMACESNVYISEI